MKTNNKIIYGKHPIFSVLKAKKRNIEKIFVSIKNKNEFLEYIKAEKLNINSNVFSFVDNNKLNSIFPYKDKNHQGYIGFVNEKKNISFNDFIANCEKKEKLPKILILDQITDPHNLGAIIRTSYAFGVENIIITSFNSAKDTSTVIKTSSGYSEFVNLIEVVNLNNAIRELKKVGYFVIGMDGNAKYELNEFKNKNTNIAIVLGNEGKGIRELVKKNCDDLIKIKMLNNVESLNVSVATAIVIYEIWGKNG